jgi:hypothetical protein
VNGPPTRSPVYLRGNSAFRQIFAVRTQLRTLDRMIGESPISLSRLLRIAEGIFGGKVGRLPWARPTSLAHGPQGLALTMMTTIPRTSSHVANHYRPSRAALAPPRRPAASLLVQNMRPLPPGLASPRFKAPIMPSGYAQIRPRAVNRPASRQVEKTAPIAPRAQRTSVIQSIALDAVVSALGSRLSASSQTFGRSRSPLEHVRQPRLLPASAIAPVNYNYAHNELIGGITRLADTSAGAISTASPSHTSAVAGLKAARSNRSGYRDGNGKGKNTEQGDLYLEGSILSRWLTQHLNREIVRPRAGIMAVDPRITPSWGGPSLAT